jgi:hypothetical protein
MAEAAPVEPTVIPAAGRVLPSWVRPRLMEVAAVWQVPASAGGSRTEPALDGRSWMALSRPCIGTRTRGSAGAGDGTTGGAGRLGRSRGAARVVGALWPASTAAGVPRARGRPVATEGGPDRIRPRRVLHARVARWHLRPATRRPRRSAVSRSSATSVRTGVSGTQQTSAGGCCSACRSWRTRQDKPYPA